MFKLRFGGNDVFLPAIGKLHVPAKCPVQLLGAALLLTCARRRAGCRPSRPCPTADSSSSRPPRGTQSAFRRPLFWRCRVQCPALPGRYPYRECGSLRGIRGRAPPFLPRARPAAAHAHFCAPNERFMPGARFKAIIAASMQIVPEPQNGSQKSPARGIWQGSPSQPPSSHAAARGSRFRGSPACAGSRPKCRGRFRSGLS